MIGFLRFVGVVNAAIWFGAAVSFTFFLVPAFFSPEMKALLPNGYNGAAAQILFKRFFVLNHWCGGIALVHLITEWLYTGRPMERLTLGVLVIVFSLGLVGGFWLHPKLKELHTIRYRGPSPTAQAEAAEAFKYWHTISRVVDVVIIMPGLLFYLWRVTSASHPSRLPGFRKMNIGWK